MTVGFYFQQCFHRVPSLTKQVWSNNQGPKSWSWLPFPGKYPTHVSTMISEAGCTLTLSFTVSLIRLSREKENRPMLYLSPCPQFQIKQVILYNGICTKDGEKDFCKKVLWANPEIDIGRSASSFLPSRSCRIDGLRARGAGQTRHPRPDFSMHGHHADLSWINSNISCLLLLDPL